MHGHYAMACDTLHISGYTKVRTVEGNRKIVQVGENLFGFAGAVINRLAVACVLRQIVPNHVLTCVEGIYVLMLEVHRLLRKEHYLTPQATYEEPFEDNDLRMLICNPHGIFCVGSDRNVMQHDNYWAAGAGMHYALGAMHSCVLADDAATNIRQLVEHGVRAACVFSDSCALPFISNLQSVEKNIDAEKKEN